MKTKIFGGNKAGFDLFIFLLILGFFIFTISGIVSGNRSQKEDREPVIREIVYWKRIALQNESYPDAWVKLAINWQKLNKTDLSKMAISKARKMDPSRKDIEDIEEQLNLRYNE